MAKLIAAIMVLFCVHSAFGIKCWECESRRDQNCGTGPQFNNASFQITDCDQRRTRGYQGGMVCTLVTENNNGQVSTSRYCTPENSVRGAEDQGLALGCESESKSVNGVTSTSDRCWCRNYDGCNNKSIQKGQGPNDYDRDQRATTPRSEHNNGLKLALTLPTTVLSAVLCFM